MYLNIYIIVLNGLNQYLYINNQDGTFIESSEDLISELSLGSMGVDIVDMNNDGFPEIFVTEMLPKIESRLKTKSRPPLFLLNVLRTLDFSFEFNMSTSFDG